MGLERRKFLMLGAGAVAAGGATPVLPGTAAASPHPPPSLPGFTSHVVVANGIRQHVVMGGRGEPLVLLHGWPQTWWEYHKVMPALAEDFRVIAVDLRGAGYTDKPGGGYDKKTMARDIAELTRKLGFSKVNIAGHDIGSMVAFSFAVNHAEATRRVCLLDVVHPDESYYEYRLLPQPGAPFTPWWFPFNQLPDLPVQVFEGRGRILIDWMFDYSLVDKDAIGELDRRIYAANYSQAATIRGSNGWYQAFGQDIEDLKTYGKVTAPMLGIAHELFHGYMAAVLPTQGTDVEVVLAENTGHYFVEERPELVIDQFRRFFG